MIVEIELTHFGNFEDKESKKVAESLLMYDSIDVIMYNADYIEILLVELCY